MSPVDRSSQEAHKLFLAYDARWGEALYGAFAAKGMSDETIIAEIEKARAEVLNF
jgi:hypothetical protein